MYLIKPYTRLRKLKNKLRRPRKWVYKTVSLESLEYKQNNDNRDVSSSYHYHLSRL
jgi:hypothetical protein